MHLGKENRHKIPPCTEMINTYYFKTNCSALYAELEGNNEKSFLLTSRAVPVAVLIHPNHYTELMTREQLDLAIPLHSSAFREINRLSAFVAQNLKSDIRDGESAVDVVIRKLKEPTKNP